MTTGMTWPTAPPGLLDYLPDTWSGDVTLKLNAGSADTSWMRPVRLLAALVLAGAAACSSPPAPEASSAPSTTTTSPPLTTTRARPRLQVTTSRRSAADRICAEIQDPAFDLRPLGERRFIRKACASERESEAQDELLRESDALDQPEPTYDSGAYEPEYPEPESEPYEPDAGYP